MAHFKFKLSSALTGKSLVLGALALTVLAAFPAHALDLQKKNPNNKMGQRMMYDQRVPPEPRATERVFTKPITPPSVSAAEQGMKAQGFVSEEQLEREEAAERAEAERIKREEDRKKRAAQKSAGATNSGGSDDARGDAQINVLEILDEDQSRAIEGHGDPDQIDAAHDANGKGDGTADKDMDQNGAE